MHVRNNLIVRPGLDKRFKTKALYELGRDYRRAGFLDRSKSALEGALELSGREGLTPLILGELAALAASSGDFERAAKLFAQLDHPRAQAHYLVRQAGERLAEGDDTLSRKLLKRALKIYPGSPEAWLAHILRACRSSDASKLNRRLADGLKRVPETMRFVLLEELLPTFMPNDGPMSTVQDEMTPNDGCALLPTMIEVIKARPVDILTTFYAGRILAACGRRDEALFWVRRAIALDSSFWPARLELMDLELEEQKLTPEFGEQLSFFVSQARSVKRFVCSICGLRQGRVFFVCPRCTSWHSIAYRMLLSD